MAVRKGLKYIIPFVSILYCIAFLEIEIGDTEQTWFDEYDTYITALHSSDATTASIAGQDFQPGFVSFLIHFLFDFPLKENERFDRHLIAESPPPARLFISYCVWLI